MQTANSSPTSSANTSSAYPSSYFFVTSTLNSSAHALWIRPNVFPETLAASGTCEAKKELLDGPDLVFGPTGPIKPYTLPSMGLKRVTFLHHLHQLLVDLPNIMLPCQVPLLILGQNPPSRPRIMKHHQSFLSHHVLILGT